MLGLPNEPLPGQPLRASDSAALIRYIKGIAPRPTPGQYTVNGSGGNTRRPIVRRAAAQPLQGFGFPWKIYSASVGETAQIQVNSGDGYAGAIGNVVANIGGVTIDYNPPLGGPYAPPLLTCNDGDSLYANCSLTTDGTAVDTSNPFAVTLMTAASVPDPDTSVPPTYANLLIGTLSVVTVTGGGKYVIPHQIVMAAQWYQLCYGVPLFGGLA